MIGKIYPSHCEKCGQAKWLSSVFPKVEAECDQLRAHAEALAAALESVPSDIYHALLEITAWMGIPEGKRMSMIKQFTDTYAFRAREASKNWRERGPKGVEGE